MAVFIFLLVIFFLVLVHEFGHFIVAKRTGMRVDEFGIGFPPRLFGIKKGETEYTLNLFPVGGFVKIFGEDSLEAVDAPDRSRSFVAQSKWAQAAVLLAGVTMNVLFAWLLFTVALSLGTETAVSETQAGPYAQLVVTDVLAGSPARDANIPVGAHIDSLHSGEDTLSSLTPSAFESFTMDHNDVPIVMTYTISGIEKTATMTPRTGVVSGDPNRGAIGIALTMLEVVAKPVHVAAYEAAATTLSTLKQIAVGLGGLLWNALRLHADFSKVAGPVGIVGLVGEASAFGFTALLMFTAFISLNLAVINVLPFPALDGGRLLFVVIEAIKGSPINPVWVSTLNTIGFALLILLMAAVTYSDIVKII